MTEQSEQSERRHAYVIGVDFGTLSGRALVVRVGDGEELGSAVHEYRHAVMHRELATSGAALPPEWALQVPDDYRDVLRRAVPEAIAAGRHRPQRVVGIATDFTASTPLPVLADGTPLCELAEFHDRPHAYVKLWKHHAAQPQADRINAVAAELGRAVAGPLRRAHLERVAVRQSVAAARGGSARSTSAWIIGSKPPTGSSGNCAASTSAMLAPPATRGSGRTEPIPRPSSKRR